MEFSRETELLCVKKKSEEIHSVSCGVVGRRNKAEKHFFEQVSQLLAPKVTTSNIEATEELASLHSVDEICSFFSDFKQIPNNEIELNEVMQQMILVSTEQLGLRLCFATYIKNMSLIIQSFLQRYSFFDPKYKKFAINAIQAISELSVDCSFYPELKKEYLYDYGIVKPFIATKTAMALASDYVFTGYSDNTIYRTSVNRIFSKRKSELFYTSAKPLGKFSLVSLSTVLFIICADEQHVAINIETAEPVPMKCDRSSYLQYPCITDGKFIYSLNLNNKVRVFEFYGNELKYVRSVSLQDGFIKGKSIMATNGSFISFLTTFNDEKVCCMMSLINGKHVGNIPLQRNANDPVLFGWVFDPMTLGHLCLTTEGLFLFPGPASVPPYALDISIPDCSIPKELNDLRSILDCYMANLLSYSIPYIGNCDIPLSISDATVTVSIVSMLESYINDPTVSSNLVHAMLILIQAKARAIAMIDSTIVNTLEKFFDETKNYLIPMRKHAAFVFFSILKFINKKKPIKPSIYESIARDESCASVIVMMLDIKNLEYECITEQFIYHVIGGILKLPKRYANNAIIFTSDLRDRIIENTTHDDTKKFEKFCSLIFSFYNEKLVMSGGKKMTDEEFMLSPVNVIVSSTFSKIIEEDLPLSVNLAQNIHGIALAQTMMTQDIDEEHKECFRKACFISLMFALNQIKNGKAFLSTKNPAGASFHPEKPKSKSKVSNILEKCIVSSIGIESEEEIEEFIQRVTENVGDNKDALKDLQNRVNKIQKIQPQPMRRIMKFIEEKRDEISLINTETISQIAKNYIWLKEQTVVNFADTFELLKDLFDSLSDDFLCLPIDQLSGIVQITPFPLRLAPQILVAVKYSITDEDVLSLKVDDLNMSFQQIKAISSSLTFDTLIAPLVSTINMTSISETGLCRALILSSIAASLPKANFTPFICTIVKRLLPFVSEKSFHLLLGFIECLVEKFDAVAKYLVSFLFEIVTNCFCGDKSMLQKQTESAYFRMVFDVISLLRKLIARGNKPVIHLFSKPSSFNMQQKVAFFAVCQNHINYMKTDANVKVITRNFEEIEGNISSISVDGRKIFLYSGRIIDLRHCKSITVYDTLFNPDNLITKDVIELFNSFECSSPVSKVMFHVSLVAFMSNESFVKKIKKERLLQIIDGDIEPCSLIPSLIWHFTNTFFSFRSNRASPFQISSHSQHSLCKSVTNVNEETVSIEGELISEGGKLLSSPILTATKARISIMMPGNDKPVMVRIQGIIRDSMSLLSYEPIKLLSTPPSEISIEFDPRNMMIKVIVDNKETHELPMFPCAELHYISLGMPEGKFAFTAEIGTKLYYPDVDVYERLDNKNIPDYVESAINFQLPHGDIFSRSQLEETSNMAVASLKHMISTIAYQKYKAVSTETAMNYSIASAYSNDETCLNVTKKVLSEMKISNEFIKTIHNQLSSSKFVVNKRNRSAIPIKQGTVIRPSFICVTRNEKIEENETNANDVSLLVSRNDLRDTTLGLKNIENCISSLNIK